MSYVLVSGGFDPLHSGHIAYFNNAAKLGKKLVVALNSDEWLTRKKGQPFMSFEERKAVIESIESVDRVISFDDSDDSACNAIYKLLSMTHDNKIIFAKGGDRTTENTPEYKVYGNTHWVDFKFGVGGGDKKNSSSWILDKWKTAKTERDWGYWRVLDDKGTVKVKELVIQPGKSLSDQRHFYRKEHWYILEGTIQIDLEYSDIIQTNAGRDETVTLKQHSTHIIHKEDWHRAYNPYDTPCHILEVQYGDDCIEEDIERR